MFARETEGLFGELRQAASLAEAVNLTRDWQPDACFLDLHLGIMQGQETLDAYDELFSTIPRVILSGHMGELRRAEQALSKTVAHTREEYANSLDTAIRQGIKTGKLPGLEKLKQLSFTVQQWKAGDRE